jgi:hypothetical protein
MCSKSNPIVDGKLNLKGRSNNCSLQETHLIDRNKHWLRVKGLKIYQAGGPQKQAGVAILISEKVDFKPTLIKRDKEGHSILIKGKYAKRK